MSKIHRKSYLPLIIIIASFFVMYLIGTKVPDSTIRGIISDSGPFGVIVFILLIWLTNFFAPLSGTPFLFAGFYMYGRTVILYATVAALLASITNFLIAKTWGRSVVEKLAGEESLHKLDDLIQNYGLKSLFFFRIFLGAFHDVVSYAYGLTRLDFFPYFFISTIGMIPGTLIWYYLSYRVTNATLFTVLSLVIAYIFLMVYILWGKIKK